MTGWFEYGVFIGATTVLAIILKKLKCNYYDNGVAIEMMVEITRRALQAYIYINCYPVKCKQLTTLIYIYNK